MLADEVPPDKIPALQAALGGVLVKLASRSMQADSPKLEDHEGQDGGPEEDEWLTKKQAAPYLNVHPHWFSGKKLPFAKKIGHRTVRYSKQGLLRWRTTRR